MNNIIRYSNYLDLNIYIYCFESNLLRSDLNVPPYFGLLPIRSMISGIHEANTA